MPVLSVIVPFHNVEKYLGACLDSIEAQTFRDLEVICVDDGSHDDGAAVVEAMSAADERVRLIRQANHGAGHARNTGVRHATGRYLAFVDGDDTLPPTAFQRLVSSLESTGSDLACGNVMRLQRNLLVPSWAHRKAFAEPLKRTHITSHPLLIRDRMVWNKVYRRSFWDDLGLSFPERRYEDQPVSVAAHVGAAAVDVLKCVVYHWRQRDEENASITQCRLEPDNLHDRLLSVLQTAELLAERAPELKPCFDRDTLVIDLTVAVEAVAAVGDAADPGLVDLAVRYLDGVAPEEWLGVPYAHRLLVHLLHRRRLDDLAFLFTQERDERLWPRLCRPGFGRRQWYGRHPAMPEHLSDVTDELELVTRLTTLEWRDGVLYGQGVLSAGRFDGRDLRRTAVRVWLEERGTGETVPLIGPAGRRGVTWERGGFPFGFAFDPAALTTAQLTRRGQWDLRVELRATGLRLAGRVATPRGLPLVPPAPARRGNTWLVPVRNRRGVWGLRLCRAQAVIGECRVDGDDLVLSGELADLGDGDPVLRLVRRSDGEEMYFPLVMAGHRFRARVALRDVDESVGPESRWEVVLDQGREIRPLVRTRERPMATVADRRFEVDRGGDGCLVLAEL
ncbi:glycosyltransferase family 2 protein [Nonomuraea cavernae]|uniref:glycosyltransferase family 2 protein n=1 Tax=Nonomuraea cavernae TaxID=2045107 RepID=UPI0033C06809